MTLLKPTAAQNAAAKPAAKNSTTKKPSPIARGAAPEHGDSELSSRFYEAFIDTSRSWLGEQQSDRRTSIALIQRIAANIGHLAEQSAERIGIHVSDFYVLLLLQSDQPGRKTPVADLQKSLGFTPGGMSRRMDRMEQAGLVQRIRDPNDARAWLATLTRKGKLLSAKIRTQRSPQLEAAYKELSAQEWQTLAGLLQRVNACVHSLGGEQATLGTGHLVNAGTGAGS